MSFIRICEDGGYNPIELEVEEDDTLLMSSLQAQFPNAIGLRYLPDLNSDVFRGVRCVDGKLKPPKEGWEGLTLYCVYPPDYKRKQPDSDYGPSSKKFCPKQTKCTDLIVLGLNFATTDETLKKYFEEKYGPLLMSLVKVDIQTKKSKGFGFIRFSRYEDQIKALSVRKHEIDSRWVTIKPPFSRDGGNEMSLPSKVFISRLTPDMTKEDVSDYFSKYGEVVDIFYPNTPFRGFAFLTFVLPESAERACDEQPHIIKNISISVVHATDQQKRYPYTKREDRGDYNRDRPGSSKYPRRNAYNDQPRNNRGNFSNFRDDYDCYDRRDDYNSAKNAPEADIGKILVAALNNPNTLSSLLNNIGGSSKAAGNRDTLSRTAHADYTTRDYNDGNDYKDYSYSDKKYGAYTDDNKGYGTTSKYMGGNSSSRY